MSTNLVIQDGVVKSLAMRYDANSKPELRFTLVQTEKEWPLYLPCFCPGAAGERLANELEDGQHILVTSGKLSYRKRTTKAGEVSRLEILVWAADVLSHGGDVTTSPGDEPNGEQDAPALIVEAPGRADERKPRKPRYGKHLQRPWEARVGNHN
jgi:hypothetical protein